MKLVLKPVCVGLCFYLWKGLGVLFVEVVELLMNPSLPHMLERVILTVGQECGSLQLEFPNTLFNFP